MIKTDMKKSIVLVLVLLVCAGSVFAANPALPKEKEPVLITSFGQSQDSNFLNLLGGRIKLDRTYETAVDPSKIDWSKYGTVIGVIGGSGKGLGSAGLDVPSELKRIEKILADARAAGVAVIGMHIGGEDRRGPNSQPFLYFAGEVDYMVVKSNGNADGYFTKLCADKNVPMYTIETTAQLQSVLKEMFK